MATVGWWEEYFLAPHGIPSAQAFGAPYVPGSIGVVGIPSGQALGTPFVRGAQTLTVGSGIISLEGFGTPVIQKTAIAPSGIASTEVFGTANVRKFFEATGIISAEAFGSAAKLNLGVQPSGVVSANAFGTATVSLPVTFDAAPTVNTGRITSNAWNIASDANAVVAWASMQSGDDGSNVVATIDGVAMTKTIFHHTTNNQFYLLVFTLLNPPTGTGKTVAFSGFNGTATYVASGAASYKHVGSFGTIVTAQGTSTTATVSVSSATGQMVALGYMFNGTESSPSYSERGFKNSASLINQGLSWGDEVGAASVSESLVMTNSNPWIAAAVPLVP